jgi:hypothetical protein
VEISGGPKMPNPKFFPTDVVHKWFGGKEKSKKEKIKILGTGIFWVSKIFGKDHTEKYNSTLLTESML